MQPTHDFPTHIPFSFPGLSKVHCAFTTRWGAHRTCPDDQTEASQAQDRSRWIQDLLQAPSWLSMEQVHGQDMAVITDPEAQYAERRPRADVLTTCLPGQALVVSVADCQPLLVSDLSGTCVAALHVGWRANRAGAIPFWVQRLCGEFGLTPDQLMAVRGPSLGPGKSEFIHFDREWGPDFRPYFHPHPQTVDLWRLSRDQLLQAGLRRDHIYSLDLCTHSLPQLFYSYRRDHTQGRQAGIIWKAP